jgi:2-oxoisovalerate ferredoxin oxidoreductase beta subunit
MSGKILKKADSFYDLYERKPGADKLTTHYCPGCGHGNLHKIIAEAIDDFGIKDRTVIISPVGCSVFAYYYFDCGNVQVAHGRAPAVATGLKRSNPDSIVISYQGDGDIAAIGGNNILQAANRGENITVIFVNNAIYGMTGGQMAPTTLIGQKTMTTPRGRNPHNEGFPLRLSELLSTLESPVYIERVALTDAKNVMKARKAVRKAIQCQIENKGFSMVEALSPCPSGWRMTPVEARKWIVEKMETYFKPGVYKDITEEREPFLPPKLELPSSQIEEILGIAEAKGEKVGRSERPEPRYCNPRIKIAGFGGQGVLLLGEALAESGMRAGYQVTWLPSYGPEMRGGTANCQVIISDGSIGSPLVSTPDVLIAMNRPSLERFEPDVREGGLIIYNSSLIDIEPKRKDVEVVAIQATEIADELGDTRVANMVVLGAYIAKTRILTKKAVTSAFPIFIKRKNLIPLNEEAVQRGIDWVKG